MNINKTKFIWRSLSDIFKSINSCCFIRICTFFNFHNWITHQFGLKLCISFLFLLLLHFESFNWWNILSRYNLWLTEKLIFSDIFLEILTITVLNRHISCVFCHFFLLLISVIGMFDTLFLFQKRYLLETRMNHYYYWLYHLVKFRRNKIYD